MHPVERLCGRALPATEPYEVSATKIVEFAEAIGDVHLGDSRSPLAPPTFAIVVCAKALDIVRGSLGAAALVHRGQEFRHERSIRAGDRLVAHPVITETRRTPAGIAITVRVEIRTSDGELVCTATSMLVVMGDLRKSGVDGID